jgi:hypothetical protein
MSQQAIRVEGLDELSHTPVRIELRVLSLQPDLPAIERLSAPRGYLPPWANEGCSGPADAEARRQAVLRSLSRGFTAPRGRLAG